MDMNTLTSGDVMAGMAFIIGVAVSIWAVLVASALIFRKRAEYAQRYFEIAPWRTFFIGLAFGGGGTTIGFILLAAAPQLLKLVGWFVLSLVFAISLIGASGFVQLAASRIATMENTSAGFSALTRAAGIIVLASMVPLFGWLAIAPVLTLTAFGAGLQALAFGPVASSQSVSAPQAGEAIQ